MPEIILPTATKQNDIQTKVTDIQSKSTIIEQTVENIASNFPLEVSGGTDFSVREPFISGSTTSHHSGVVLEITGSGILHSIIPAGGSDSIRVEIDGLGVHAIPYGTGISPTFLLGFKDKLKITSPTSMMSITKVIYSLD